MAGPLILDTVVSRVFGFITARDCRVVWKDGVLYVAKSPQDVTAIPCDAPVKSAGTYKVAFGEGQALRFQVPSCGSCRARVQKSPVGKMSVEDIIAAAQVDA